MNSVGRLATLLSTVIGIVGCCDENVKVLVLAGHQEPRACIQAMKEGKSSPLAVICAEKEVTICWASNVQDVKIEPLGVMSHGTAISGNFGGVEYFKPTMSVTVTATASPCAASSQDVTVISGDTPVTFDTGWTDPKCTQIDYEFDPVFVDADARAINITALWTPFAVHDLNGVQTECKTPPYLLGNKMPESHGFEIDKPAVTKAFSPSGGLKLAGNWGFLPKFTCPGGFYCQAEVMPFVHMVRCPTQ